MTFQAAKVTPQLCESPVSSKLLENIDTLVLDYDGVLWQGDELIEGSREALEKLR